MPAIRKFLLMHWKILGSLLPGICVWLMEGWTDMNSQGWRIFSVFIAVIISFILRPFPMGMSVLLGLIVLAGTGTITIKESLTGFSDTTVWLVIAALLIAGTVINSGLGKRIALWLISKMGRSLKGLGYAICTSEFILGSVIPSNTARGGGIHAPIVDSLARSFADSSTLQTGAGSYLCLIGSHANLIAASIFMTGMAANPLVSEMASSVFGLEFGWGTWLLGSIIPGIVSLGTLPIIISWMVPVRMDNEEAAQSIAKNQLSLMRKISKHEKVLLAVLTGMLVLWITAFIHHLPTTLVAWIGVAVLLLSGTQSWQEVLENNKAWDTLFWLGGLLTMATMLSEYGFIQWFVDKSGSWVEGIPGIFLLVMLALIYFYSMYGFSMLSGHIAAMVAPFFILCQVAGTEPMITVAIFAYFSCLCGCTTNYSSGPVIIYYALGYNNSRQWFGIGFIMSLIHITIWLGIGLLWWKVLGWW